MVRRVAVSLLLALATPAVADEAPSGTAGRPAAPAEAAPVPAERPARPAGPARRGGGPRRPPKADKAERAAPGAAARSEALPPSEPDAPAPTPAPAAHAEGDYGGVAPGRPPASAPGRKARRPPARGALSWVGFAAKNGGAQVFFQSPGPFEVSQRVEGGVLVVHLAGLRALGSNAQRPIDTRYFDNPLALISARRVGAAGAGPGRHPAGVEVRLAFKNPKDARQASLRTATEADGMFYAYLELAEGAEGRAGDGDR